MLGLNVHWELEQLARELTLVLAIISLRQPFRTEAYCSAVAHLHCLPFRSVEEKLGRLCRDIAVGDFPGPVRPVRGLDLIPHDDLVHKVQ